MDNQRAKDIVSYPVMVDVTYNDMPIYIEAVNENNNTAKIHFLDQPENKQEVSLNNLIEH
ncbi:MAG: Small acid-soluble spore protein H (Minor) [Sporanaerobacter sp.]|jgi:small acid-soluble spore protein H (minor)|uniref:H-type small acid-soluble spore protein n=1 Tax=Sporanaerobacter sp. TaxID=2010183 RepID=UPI003A102AF7